MMHCPVQEAELCMLFGVILWGKLLQEQNHNFTALFSRAQPGI